jgi:hypothetical protein
MSSSECEAVACYQKYFCDNYLYKHPYEWDGRKRALVKVTNSKDVFLRQFHIPAVSSLTAIPSMIFVIHYHKWFPNAIEVSYLARTVQYAGIPLLVIQSLTYLVTIVYQNEITLGCNRLVTYNDEISEFKIRFRIS